MPATRLCPACFGAHLALDAALCAECRRIREARAAWSPVPPQRGGERPSRDPRDLLAVPMSTEERAAVDAALRRPEARQGHFWRD